MPTQSIRCSIVWHTFSISECEHIDGLPHNSNLYNTVTYSVQTNSNEILNIGLHISMLNHFTYTIIIVVYMTTSMYFLNVYILPS